MLLMAYNVWMTIRSQEGATAVDKPAAATA
jgi:cbb3-type cytochrome oxidase subunit 1